MRHLFLINPAAGKRGSTDALVRRIGALFADRDHGILLTAAAGDAERFAREAAEEGTPLRIYACGGDGTLNEVVNGAAGCPHVAVTNVPKGTGNDFLRIFGPDFRSGFSDLAALAEGPQAEFDLIDCNGRLGIDVVCAGVDARIAAGVHRYKSLPLVTGMGAYGLSLVEQVLLKGIARPASIQVEGEALDGPISIICVCNGRYYGGGFMPVGEAMPDDGVLDTLVVPQVSRATFFRLLHKYATGRYRECPGLVRHFHGQGLTFSGPEELVAVVDGEVLRSRTFTVRLAEQKINFFYPGYLNYAPHN